MVYNLPFNTVPKKRAPNLYESSQVSQFRFCSHCHVKDQCDINGNHRDHVNDVQRVMEKLPLVWSQQQPGHHLKVEQTKHVLLSCILVLLDFDKLTFCDRSVASEISMKKNNTCLQCANYIFLPLFNVLCLSLINKMCAF